MVERVPWSQGEVPRSRHKQACPCSFNTHTVSAVVESLGETAKVKKFGPTFNPEAGVKDSFIIAKNSKSSRPLGPQESRIHHPGLPAFWIRW